MTPLRLLTPAVAFAFVFIAPLWGRALPASAAACDSVKLYTLHTGQKSAWDSKNWENLYSFNIEEAKYTDACGHKESGTDRARDLSSAALHYNGAAGTELGRKWFDLAKKHYQRSNAIIAELLSEHDADSDMRDRLKHFKINNDDGIKRAERHQSTTM